MLHLTIDYVNTLCGFPLSEWSHNATHVKYYSLRNRSFGICDKCDRDPRVPLFLLDNTDL